MIMKILTTMVNGCNVCRIEEREIRDFQWVRDKEKDIDIFEYALKEECRWRRLEDDKYNKEYLMGLRD